MLLALPTTMEVGAWTLILKPWIADVPLLLSDSSSFAVDVSLSADGFAG